MWPTHGAGSFCSAPPGAARVTTIGAEKAANPLLAAPGQDAFAGRLLASLGSYPAYFARLAEVNRHGPAPLAGYPGLAPLTPAALGSLVNRGGWLIDVRPIAAFAAGHIPGAVSIPLRGQFATWLGWLVPDAAPMGFVLADGQDPAEVAWQALKIGYENLAGQLDGGMPAWRPAAGPSSTPRWSPPAAWTAAWSWTSGRMPSLSPVTSPGRPTSSLATCRAGRTTRPAGRW